MFIDTQFTKENLNFYLKEMAVEFRRLNGTSMPAEMILIGGASILANYGFRDMTYDIDAVISASSAIKDAINRVSDRYNLPNGWLNMDVRRTASYSDKLSEVSVYYRTFSNILTVRTVAAEYLIAMKLMSGRQYKNDLSDVAGILWEHRKNNKPISREAIDKAIATLYRDNPDIPAASRKFIDDIFASGDYEAIYHEIRKGEIQSRKILLDYGKDNKNGYKTINEESIASILEKAKLKREEGVPFKNHP